MDTILQPKDLFLVYIKDEFAFYGRVEEILPDRKRGWLNLRFSVLTRPLSEVIWILEPAQIDGEPFTMAGTPVRIEKVPDPVPTPSEDDAPKSPRENTPAKVISFPGKAKT